MAFFCCRIIFESVKQAHFYCFGVIGEADLIFKAFTGEDAFISSKSVRDFVTANAAAEELFIHINSRGGDVDEGFAIHDILVNSGKKIRTRVEGQAYSIASVVLLAGDDQSREMTEHSRVGIHNPYLGDGAAMSGMEGDAIISVGEKIKKTEARVLNFYVKKTGSDKETIEAMMNADTAMDPDKAIELKFVNTVVTPVKALAYFNINHSKKTDSLMEKLEKTFNVFAKKMENLAAGKGFKILALDVTTSDGQSLTVSDDDADGMPSKGDKVTDKEGKPYASQTTELSDKTKITTDETGVITEVTAPASDSTSTTAASAAAAAATAAAKTPDAKDQEIKKLKEQNAALQTKVDSFQDLEKKMEARMTQLASLISSNATLETGAQGFQRQAGAAAQLTKDEVKAKIKERNQKK